MCVGGRGEKFGMVFRGPLTKRPFFFCEAVRLGSTSQVKRKQGQRRPAKSSTSNSQGQEPRQVKHMGDDVLDLAKLLSLALLVLDSRLQDKLPFIR